MSYKSEDDKMEQKNVVVLMLIASVLFGAIGGAATSLAVLNQKNSEEALIREFYLTENAVLVSPHSLRIKMDKGINDYILVDLRSKEEYEGEHIVGAINIPAYDDKARPTNNTARIIAEFSKLPKDKDIIVYCYSMPCMTGRKIGKLLAENGIYVKHLGIGWNEWRYYWNSWNHPWEFNTTNSSDYIVSGKEPGVPKIKNESTVCAVGGC